MSRCFARAVLILLLGFALLLPVWEMLLGVHAFDVDITQRLQPASVNHPLGTDELGRDIFLRLAQGGGISFAIMAAATAMAVSIGVAVGVMAGYFRGTTDSLLMRFTDFIIGLPLMPLLIILAAQDNSTLGLPTSIIGDSLKIALLVGVMGWTSTARLVRSQTLSLRSREYILVARSMGGTHWHRITRHILPNLRNLIMIAVALTASRVLLLESGLSFLGFGIQPPYPTWGNMLITAQDTIGFAPLLAIYPGACIFLTVMGLTVLSDRHKKL